MRRGEIWWASLPTPRGSEPGHRRPILIVSADAYNRSAIQTVLVVAITSNERLAEAPGNVRVTRKQSGLSKVSVINVSQVLTLDKGFLTERIRKLPDPAMQEVSVGLGTVFGLTGAGV